MEAVYYRNIKWCIDACPPVMEVEEDSVRSFVFEYLYMLLEQYSLVHIVIQYLLILVLPYCGSGTYSGLIMELQYVL